MSAPSSEQVRAPSIVPELAAAAASALAEEMIERWREGERPLSEEFLNRQPELWNHPEAAAELIYEELCLRQEYGVLIAPGEVMERFPQWRRQLELLLDCQSLLSPGVPAPAFPEAGESVGDFQILTELGRGSHGRVYLAAQRSLSGRRVVLKLVAPHACEHLLLARLQHTHIVPLYSVEEVPDRGLRALCMPYFGGATLAQLLERMRANDPSHRSGRELLSLLDQYSNQQAGELPIHDGDPQRREIVRPGQAAARQFLTRGSYVNAICWIGVCLADALQYAHERGLLHLDLKPSNVLLAADGQPMLLDFHLAREPVDPRDESIPWLGGTTGYMSPEQMEGLQAVLKGRPVGKAVDARSDIYSLGIVLHEALSGSLPAPKAKLQYLMRCNQQVSPGLAAIVVKCLAEDPDERYQDMPALANDLRRHLANLPLCGVRNRSLAERWRKWRRRSPQGIARASMLFTVLTALGVVILGLTNLLFQKTRDIESALQEARLEESGGEWETAIRNLQRAETVAGSLPFRTDLVREVTSELNQARQGRREATRQAGMRDLHALADRVRFLAGVPDLPASELHQMGISCQALWEKRHQIAAHLCGSDENLESGTREDLLDIVLFLTDLQVHLASPADKAAVRKEALETLDQAGELCGSSPVLALARSQLGGPADRFASGPASAWEHCALGRLHLRAGAIDRAAAELNQAVALDPHGLWPSFYQGLCAYRRGRYADATVAFSVCIGASPDVAGCFYNRGRSYAALGRADQALADYDQALRINPNLSPALVNRGLLQLRAGRCFEARNDIERASHLGQHAGGALLILNFVQMRQRGSGLDYWLFLRDLLQTIGF